MAPGEQGIATKESDMPQQKLVWSEGPLSVYEWSKLDLGAKLRQLKGLLKSLS